MNASTLRSLEAAEAARALSVRDDDPAGWTRRRFLQTVAYGTAGGMTLAGLDAASGGRTGLIPGQLRDAWAAQPVAANEGILVIITMFGGNDGLNTLIPFADGRYAQIRKGLAVPANQVLKLNGSVGLHPNLGFLKSMYDAGKVAAIQGVGYPNADRSHFFSMALWMAGQTRSVPTSGWIGRWLDGLGGTSDPFRAASIGQTVPLHMIGETRRASGIPEYGDFFGTGTEEHESRLYNGVRQYSAAASGRGQWHDAIARVERDQLDVATAVNPFFEAALPESEIVKKLTIAARMINANLGLRVLDVGWGDFDSHDDQPNMHPARMAEFNEGLQQFFTTLDDAWRGRVTIMTVSEFGRQPYPNDSLGTDHGEASCLFVIGDGVKGGLYGQYPTLAGLDEWDGLAFNVDYRSVYASVLDGWMGGGSSTVLGQQFENLGLFRAAPGAGDPPPGPPPPALLGDFVPLQPERLLDTRSGIGGRSVPLGAGTTIDVSVLGVAGIPATGVTAVALNVTAVDASAESYFTVWPRGASRPNASSLNFAAGKTVPNLVVAQPGSGGRISVYNAFGNVHALADVVGYFRESTSDRLLPLSPYRLLDTRNGIGANRAKLGKDGVVALKVTGVPGSGVPATGVDAVVLNVTATGPTAQSYLTVWPGGAPRPNASSLNYNPGQTVPNLVIAKVGTGGIVNLYNAFGAVDVIADVVGCFTTEALGRHKPVGPDRILDTRNGIFRTGALGAETMTMPIAGRAGVPAKATAAIINVTVTAPTAESYLTVWPSGVPMPTASNLNYQRDLTVANLVLVKLGTGGAVNLANAFGSTHLIADVVGYFE